MGPLRPFPRQASGFGLLELMITVAIAAILMLWAVPSFGVWVANARIRSVAEALQADLRTAQAASLSQDRAISLVLVDVAPIAANVGASVSSSSVRWLVRRATSAPTPDAADFLTGYSAAAEGGDVRVTPLAGGTGEVRFNAFGRVAAASAVGFSVEAPSGNPDHRPLRVVVSPGGNVRMCDPDTRLGTNDSRRC